jgi:hypothetical protein
LCVIEEELHELRLEIFKRAPNPQLVRSETVQLCAMAARLVLDCLAESADPIP